MDRDATNLHVAEGGCEESSENLLELPKKGKGHQRVSKGQEKEVRTHLGKGANYKTETTNRYKEMHNSFSLREKGKGGYWGRGVGKAEEHGWIEDRVALPSKCGGGGGMENDLKKEV